ncbi:hypothetical protein [Nostoc sp.]|uniref:hypothetical protein n=1 Tax=Nostoc sp. TaxID=1180 RepID=UPI002FF656CE
MIKPTLDSNIRSYASFPLEVLKRENSDRCVNACRRMPKGLLDERILRNPLPGTCSNNLLYLTPHLD